MIARGVATGVEVFEWWTTFRFTSTNGACQGLVRAKGMLSSMKLFMAVLQYKPISYKKKLKQIEKWNLNIQIPFRHFSHMA